MKRSRNGKTEEGVGDAFDPEHEVAGGKLCAGDAKSRASAEGSPLRHATASHEVLSLDAADAGGISLQDVLAGRPEEEPDEVAGRTEWLQKVAEIFDKYVDSGRAEAGGKGRSAIIERASILWHEHFADFYLELAELRENESMLSSLPFPPPSVAVIPMEEKGQHNPQWADYVARHIGVLRAWTESQIDADLAQQRTPKDLSRLRAAVRVRRNEGKVDIGLLLRKLPA